MEATANVPLLRHDQVQQMEEDIRVCNEKLQNPRIEDKGVVRDQLNRIQRQLETQRPRPFASAEMDAAVRREAELRDEISRGMLSHEEMRKSPPGAIDRHLQWERKNIKKIEEWQNIQRRMTAGSDDQESASVERFRPTNSTMNMDGALIAGKNFFLPPYGAGLPVTFSNDQLALLRQMNPDLADRLATLDNRTRAEVKDALDGKGIGLSEQSEPSAASIAGKKGAEKKKRKLSAEHKAAMKAGREARAKKAA